jgi:hypothetical protein
MSLSAWLMKRGFDESHGHLKWFSATAASGSWTVWGT